MATNYDAVIKEQLAKIPAPTIASPVGLGELFVLALPKPAAQANFAHVNVPPVSIWRIRGFGGQLTTDATVVNRWFRMKFSDAKLETIASGQAVFLQGPSRNPVYFGQIGSAPTPTANVSSDVDVIGVSLPDILLPAGYRIDFGTTSIAPTDQWDLGFLYIEQWSDQNRILGWLRG